MTSDPIIPGIPDERAREILASMAKHEGRRHVAIHDRAGIDEMLHVARARIAERHVLPNHSYAPFYVLTAQGWHLWERINAP